MGIIFHENTLLLDGNASAHALYHTLRVLRPLKMARMLNMIEQNDAKKTAVVKRELFLSLRLR